ncbi:probable lysine-specific demethylase 3B at C-terminar half [Coccomyxa sp. Obi]|nr:probable lysine-specific demethylase 3B at C-terminar half [Coccomyxa sp. Obi]
MSGQTAEVLKQRVREWPGWEGVDLGDLFEHAHAAAEVLCDEDIAKDIFRELVKLLEDSGYESLQPFGSLKEDVVVLALQGDSQKVAFSDGKIMLRSHSASSRRPGSGTANASKITKNQEINGLAATDARSAQTNAASPRSSKENHCTEYHHKGQSDSALVIQDNTPSRTSTLAVDVVDTSVTKGEVMAARLRTAAHKTSLCNSTARMPPACPLQAEEATLPEQAAAVPRADSVAADEPGVRAEAASSGAEPVESKRSQSVPLLGEDERQEWEEQRKAAQRSTRSDREVQYLNERDNMWQQLMHGEPDPAEAGPGDAAGCKDVEQEQDNQGAHEQQQHEAGQQCARPCACSAKGEQPEAAGATPAPVEGNDAPGQPTAVEAHAEEQVLQGSGAADCPGSAAAHVRQLLHKKLAAKGKLHLEPLAANWEMGKHEATNKVWIKPPGKRILHSCPQAILVLEEMHAEQIIATKSGTWTGAADEAGKQQLGQARKPRKPVEVDQHSALGSPPEPATQDVVEHTSPPQLPHLKVPHLEEQVQTSPALSAPNTPRGGRPKRATHKPDPYNPSPFSKEEKRCTHEEQRMLERQASARETAEARGYPVPQSLGQPAIAGDMEQAPAESRGAPSVLTPAARGDAQPGAAESSRAPPVERTFVRRGRGRGRGRARGVSRGGGRGMAGSRAPVRGRHCSDSLGRAAALPSQDDSMPDTAEAPAQPHTGGNTGANGSGGPKGRKRAKEGGPVAAGSPSKRPLRSGDSAQEAAKKPRRSGPAGPSVGAGDSTAAKRRTGPSTSSNPPAGKGPSLLGHKSGSNAGFAKKFQVLLGLVRNKVDETFHLGWGGKPAVTHSMSRGAGEEVTAANVNEGRATRRAAAPKSFKEESEYKPEDSEPSDEDSPEPDTDSEVIGTGGSNKKPASAKSRSTAAAKRGQRKGGNDGPKIGALAPARQPLPPSEGRNKEGHYWLNRPEEKLVQLPKHKKDCTKKQVEVGGRFLPAHWCCELMDYIEEVATDEEWQRYAEGWCPRCLGFCICRACMRKPHPRAAYSAPEHQTEEYARHVLRYVGPLVADQQRHKDAEAAAGNKQQPYADLKWNDPEEFRHLCDRCATSIPDLHRTCGPCTRAADGYDLCLHCCVDVRGPDQEVKCPLGHPMELVRFFTDDMVRAVQQTIHIVEDGEKSLWEWRPELKLGPKEMKAAAPDAISKHNSRSGKVGRPKRKAAGESEAGVSAKSASATAAAHPAATPTVTPQRTTEVQAKAASAQRQDTIAPRATVDMGSVSDVDIMASEAAPLPGAVLLQSDGLADSPSQLQPVSTPDRGLPQPLQQLTGADGQVAAPEEPSPNMARFMAEVRQSVKVPERFRGAAEPSCADQPAHEAADTLRPMAQTAQLQDSTAKSEPRLARKRVRREQAAGRAQEAGGTPDVKRFRQEVHDKFPTEAAAVAPYLQTMSETWLGRLQAAIAPEPHRAAVVAAEPSAAPAEPCDIEMTDVELAAPAAQPAAVRMFAFDDAPVAAAASGAALPTSMRPVDPSQEWWHQRVPDECKRLAAKRLGAWQNYVFTPHADDLAMFNPDRAAQVRLFQEVWREGVPVVVRCVRKGYPWDPATMGRATTEKNSRFGQDREIEVIDCEDWNVETMKQGTFFKLYEKDNEEGTMYKLKDWPPNAHFSQRLGRHNQDFMEMLPMPEYSHPRGPLNLVSYLEDNSVKPDLGPKSYVAFGRVREHAGDGDSVTKLHCDLSDAVNLMCHVAGEGAGAVIRCGDTPADTRRDPSYGGAGAVWDIWPRDCREQLSAYLRAHAAEFAAEGLNVNPDNILHPIHDQDFFLTAKHRAQLKKEYGVESWHFEQHADEAVFIPAGCPHQVRNLKSCIKVAIDFVSPESAAQCLELTHERRVLTLRENEMAAEGEELGAPADRRHTDKLQAELMVARAAAASLAHLR